MTEREWRGCNDPMPMLDTLRDRASDRKLRLFAVACCRQVWDALPYGRSRRAVELAEGFADGRVEPPELLKGFNLARQAAADYRTWCRRHGLTKHDVVGTVEARLYLAAEAAHVHSPFLIGRLRWLIRASLPTASHALRCVFGNPFRPVTADPRWLTSAAVGLAQAIYSEWAFDRFPILADALEEAGCDNADVLAHCRGGGPHVRGCWVVDLLLGKD